MRSTTGELLMLAAFVLLSLIPFRGILVIIIAVWRAMR